MTEKSKFCQLKYTFKEPKEIRKLDKRLDKKAIVEGAKQTVETKTGKQNFNFSKKILFQPENKNVKVELGD